jgi:hypothetical protein
VKAQVAPGPTSGKGTVPSQEIRLQNDLSTEFREVAGDAFDAILSLNDARLRGQLFYEPAMHEAEFVVHKTNRKAVSEDEKHMAMLLETLTFQIDVYRTFTQLHNTDPSLMSTGKLALEDKRIKKNIAEITELLKKPLPKTK